MLAAAARHGNSTRVDLQGLRRQAVSALLARAVAGEPAPALVEAVLSATRGNPLFVSELVKLAAQGQLDVADGTRGLPVPQRVRDVLRWQFERMTPDCQRLLQLLSVVGRELELAVLAHALEASHSVLLKLFGEAEAAGFALIGREHTPSFGFVHDLVRESIYRDLPLPERERLHHRMANAFAAVSGAGSGVDASQLAYHYALGIADGGAEQALRWSSLAAKQANARMAYEDAVSHYDRALSALPLLARDPKLTCELLLRQAEAAWGTHEGASPVQARFVAAAEAARMAGEPELFARAALGRSGHGAGPGDFRDIVLADEQDIALLSEALQRLDPAPSELRALVLARLSLAIRYGREFARADQLSAEAVRMAEAVGSKAALGEALRYRHDVLSGPRFARERLQIAERMLQLARELRSRSLELDALIFTSRDSFKLLDAAGSFRASSAVQPLAAGMKHPGALYKVGIGRVFLSMMLGDFAKAERRARTYLERDAARNLNARGTFDVQLGMLSLLRGDAEQAITSLLARLAVGSPLAWTEAALANAYVLAGRMGEARDWYEKASADGFARLHDHNTTLGGYLYMVELCVVFDERERAAELYQLMLPFKAMLALPLLSTVWQGPVAHGLGVLAAYLGRGDAARGHFEHALQTARTVRSPPTIASTEAAYGALLWRHGNAEERARGAELLASAERVALQIGMGPLAERCRLSRS